MALTLISPPTGEPVALADVKGQIRLDPLVTSFDTLLTSMITRARTYFEQTADRQLHAATWQLTLDRFPEYRHPIELPRPPLVSVSSVQYVDETGATQTLDPSTYIVDANNDRGRIGLVDDQVWPPTAQQINSVVIQFVAGYGQGNVPPNVQLWILQAAAYWYENPYANEPGFPGSDAIFWSEAAWEFA